MKLRLGFVSNSSSTSYVIALTRDFRTTQEKMQKFVDDIKKYDRETLTLEQADEKVGEIIETLCSNKFWHFEHDEHIEHMRTFLFSFGEDIKIANIDGGPDDGSVTNILADKCKDVNLKQLKKIMEQLK